MEQIRKLYNSWAGIYDTNENKTRDLEAIALRGTLKGHQVHTCLELGCGTGKNSIFLKEIANQLIAVDGSENMLEKARKRLSGHSVNFHLADINLEWSFLKGQVDLVVFSLVLEHIEALEPVFEKLSRAVAGGGLVYIGELHPFKQYSGSVARFEDETGLHVLPAFTHHVSDFTQPALKYGFRIVQLEEYFDGDDRSQLPRILSILLQKC